MDYLKEPLTASELRKAVGDGTRIVVVVAVDLHDLLEAAETGVEGVADYLEILICCPGVATLPDINYDLVGAITHSDGFMFLPSPSVRALIRVDAEVEFSHE